MLDQNPQILCRLAPGPLDWRVDGLSCLTAISLGNARLTQVPQHIVMPSIVASVCDILWHATQSGDPPKEWIAALLTLDGARIYWAYVEGEIDYCTYTLPDARGERMGIPLMAHTHPNRSYPSSSDLLNTIGNNPNVIHKAASMVVAGLTTFLVLRDDRGPVPSAWIYRSEDRRNFYRLSGDEVERVYR